MPCIISGCRNVATNAFGVRLRNVDTNAIWAPNTEAMICDEHAVCGIRVTIDLQPTDTGYVETVVSSAGGAPVRRSLRITRLGNA